MREKSTVDLLGKIFGHYYRENAAEIKPPKSIASREFGFMFFKEGIMLRHKSFGKAHELIQFIKSRAPANIYYSSAYYKNPKEEMDNKNWVGADLVFDIDADHIQKSCTKDHRYWVCKECSYVSKVKNECSQCGSKKFDEEVWICEECLKAARDETVEVRDILLNDLGFSMNEIDVFFSGQRGYHIHVENERIRYLDRNGRQEIADFVYGVGVNPLYLGFPYRDEKGRKLTSVVLDTNARGWKGRMTRQFIEWFYSLPLKEFAKIYDVDENSREIAKLKQELVEKWTAVRKVLPVTTASQKFFRLFDKFWEEGKFEERTEIDTVVTTDIHRLIRLPMTLHGKTGFQASKIQTNKVEDFDPLKDAVAFKKEFMTVFVNESMPLRIGDNEIRAFKKEKVELPLAAAVFLLCKKVAQPID